MMRLIILSIFSALLFACSEADKTDVSQSTVVDNVEVLPYEFLIDGLDRRRKVRLYLPVDYASSEQAYPVLYMQDGQNMFDNATAEAGEWEVDEALNTLAQKQGPQFIAVAIDSDPEYRMTEYSPWENKRFGKAQGQAFLDFIVEVVKPFIDSNYRTLSGVEDTAIVGSAMGGLFAHYAIHAYPTIFGKAMIFSPAYWYSSQVFEFTQSHKAALSARLYIMYGDKEGDGMIADLDHMQRQLKVQGHPRENMVFNRVTDGEHNVRLWRQQFPVALSWLFGY